MVGLHGSFPTSSHFFLLMQELDGMAFGNSSEAPRKRKFRNTDATIRRILTETKTIALVGASDKVERPSHEVMLILLEYGYDVIPINPRLKGTVLMGHRVLGSLQELETLVGSNAASVTGTENSRKKVMVDIFRNSKAAAETVKEVIALGTNVISSVWMQIGVVNEDSAQLALEAGFDVAMNVCPAEEIPRLGITFPNQEKKQKTSSGVPVMKKQRRAALR